MSRSTFLLISAILAGLMGLYLGLVPGSALQGFGVAVSPDTLNLARGLGGLIFSTAVLSFLVRNHGDGETLAAVLLYIVIAHAIGLLVDIPGLANGSLQFAKVAPGYVFHLLLGGGALWFWLKMRRPA